MKKRFLILATLGTVGAVSSIPTTASAQRYGVYIGSGNRDYYDDDGRRDAWVAHERHERWEQEQARRRYWEHERWEREHARRNWDGDRWEHRRYEDRDDRDD